MPIARVVPFLTLLFAFSGASLAVGQQQGSAIGTWFGTFDVTNPDGKISHDTAVLVVRADGSTFQGSMGRTIDQQKPWTGGRFEHNQLRFHLDAAGGLDVVLELRAGQLTGAVAGKQMNAQVKLSPAPGLLPHAQLLQEITAADQQLYDAFEKCDLARYGSLLDKNLEFYQDRTGKTGYEENLKAVQNRCDEGIKLRRELDADSLIVDSAPGFGAIQAGIHRFYSQGADGQEHLDATARFTNIWSKESGSWKLVRAISYDHR
jgi:ketosteroid isomerase-like protein